MDLNGKRVLVTGADGFIGSHLVEFLVRKGANVKALSVYNSFNNWGWLEDIDCLSQVEVVSGDVRDSAFCRKIVKDVEVIYNLAALIAIPYSYIAPESYIDTNVKGALNICQAALDNGVSRVIQISTSEVYGTARYVPIDEKHPLQPQSPYSASKIGADAIAMSFYHTFNLPVIIARPFNTYGPRQSARAVIPTIIMQLAAGKKQIKIGDGRPTRDFNYVADTCKGLYLLGTCDNAIGQSVNIGSNYEISVNDTIKKIIQIMGCDAEIICDKQRIRPENSEVFRLWCDNTKITELTGFKPDYSIDEGLKETIKWFSDKNNLKKYKVNIYNV
ncbi:MAG: NAD-dependent 4,6-dehydratase LegB [Burkholderiales bacterium]